MYNHFQKSAIFLLITLSTSLVVASEYHAGIYLDSSIPSFQIFAIKRDLNYLVKNDLLNADEDLREILNQNDMTGLALHNWIYNRVKFIIGEDYKMSGRNYLSSRLTFTGFQYPNTPVPVIEKSATSSLAGSVIMSNVGTGLYFNGKRDNLLKGLRLDGKKIFAKSTRVGILKIGAGLFAGSTAINDNVNSEANTIKRLGTLFHEARHSDGNAAHIGFYHHKCPMGHSLYGFHACEPYANGAYTLGAMVRKNYLKNCDSCSLQDKAKLEVSITDALDRVVYTTHLKSKEELIAEIEMYENVIKVYIDLIAVSQQDRQSLEEQLARFEADRDLAKNQLLELQGNPRPKRVDPSPEGDYREVSIGHSSSFIKSSVDSDEEY